LNLTILLPVVLTVCFVIVVWNMILPLSSQHNADFLTYTKHVLLTEYEQNGYAQQYFDRSFVKPASMLFSSMLMDNPDGKIALGPRHMHGNATHYVTLTFYVEYGNHQYLPDLLNLLHQYNIDKAVFFVEKDFIQDRPFAIETIKHHEYIVNNWNNVTGYDRNYAPTVFQGVPLSDREMLSHIKRDYITSDFFDIALHNENATIVAFNPKIMEHKMILEEILKHNGKSLVFTDDNKTTAKNVYDLEYTNVSSGLEFFANADTIMKYDPLDWSITEESLRNQTNVALRIQHGIWTLDSLREKYPSDIVYVPAKNAFMILRPITIEKDAALKILDDVVLLRSSTQKNTIPAYILVKGKAVISNSEITSWDPVSNTVDPNHYHPRPSLIASEGGKMNILNSTITHLGYSFGGFSDTRYARSAISYYNAKDFIITNSTIAFNYYGFYSADSSNFQIIGNKVYGNVGYGLDPHTNSTDFIIDSNHVHDNGYQGIICSLKCKDVTITNNIVEFNGEGIGLHWLTNSSLIMDNLVRFNQKYGIFIQKDSFDNVIQNNIVIGNGSGIGLLDGSNNNTVVMNTVANNLEAIHVDPDSRSNSLKENRFSLETTSEYPVGGVK